MSSINNNSDKNLWNQWVNFGSTIFHPPVLFFLFCTGGLLIANYFTANKIVTALISALMILSAAISGAFIRKRWEELTEKPHLLAKGKMAVRNLRNLSNNIGYYELRLRKYIERIDTNDISKERVREYFEEFIDWCLSLNENCLTSIENWEDIIPEIKDLTSKIGTLFDLRVIEEELKNQISLLSKRLEESEQAKGKSAEEKDNLVKLLKKKEEEVKIVERNVKELRQSIRSSMGGLTTNITTLGTSGFDSPLGNYGLVPLEQRSINKICQFCNKPYYTSGILSFIDEDICDECKILGKGIPLSGGS